MLTLVQLIQQPCPAYVVDIPGMSIPLDCPHWFTKLLYNPMLTIPTQIIEDNVASCNAITKH